VDILKSLQLKRKLESACSENLYSIRDTPGTLPGCVTRWGVKNGGYWLRLMSAGGAWRTLKASLDP
jgi:hypothetical protein